MTDLQDYQQYQPTDEDKQAALLEARKLIYGKPFKDICQVFALMLLEQTKHTKEINDHRAARGFKLMPTFSK